MENGEFWNMQKRIRVSGINPRYLEDETGKTYLPIGCNLCFFRDSERVPEETVLETYRAWMTDFAANGGNFMRVWLGVPFFDVMPERIGRYDGTATEHIRYIVNLAERLGLRVKFTLEHFRSIEGQSEAESFPGVVKFHKPLYAGLVSTMREYLNSPECRKAYLDKARYLAEQGFGDSPAVIAWELWNEINSIGPVRDIGPWSDYMIGELRKIFPRQLIVQNLGSFSGTSAYQIYDYLATVRNNGFLQAHRYLDPGAQMDVCRGAMDVLCADCIRELHDRNPAVPAILAETGAVEANHARYSDLYDADREGTLLHDMLFAPFFAGSAGCGQPWHWDHIYLSRYGLWYHFARFAKAVEGVDPAAEQFAPFHTETHRLRVYGLRGRTMDLLWCRDKRNDWRSELVGHCPPEPVTGERIPVGGTECSCYLPWEDRTEPATVRDGWCILPEFKRSIVVKCRHSR